MQIASKSFPLFSSIIEASLEFGWMFGNGVWAELPDKEKSEVKQHFLNNAEHKDILAILLMARQILL